MSRRKKDSVSKDYIYDAILQLFTINQNQIFAYKQLMTIVAGLDGRKVKSTFDEVLYTMLERGLIEEVGRAKFRYNHLKVDTITGVVVGMSSQTCFVKVADEIDDVIVLKENMNRVLMGDRVELHVFPSRKRVGRQEGVVTNILERSAKNYVGVIEYSNSYAFVMCDSRSMPYDIFVSADDMRGAKDGDKVICRVTRWDETDKSPVGKVVEILGKEGDNDTEMHAILAEYDLPYHFPKHVERAAEDIKDDFSPRVVASRRDFTGVTTFTIDPKDAKDFDDALSIQKVEQGWEVGVHIADVTHYVHPGDTIDKEAQERATSVYLVDRTIPMLPERLSNGLCSLRPHEKKMCFSCVFTMSEEGEVLSHWIGRTVIYSDRRFTYEDAQEVLESGEGDYALELCELNRLSKILRQERFKNGSIAFERDEVKFILDEKGKPTGVYFKESKDANHLIEEFMLLANKKVAEFVGKQKAGKSKAPTFVYRIHDKPNSDKFNDFCGFVAKFGYSMNVKNDKAIAKQLNKLLSDIKGKSVENLFSTLAIRSMAKATYSTDNIGHYGLAFDHYSHFTSPIRRYPDMMVHRLLQRYLDGGRSVNKDEYEELCEHSSSMEVRASEAERASIKYKMVEYMLDHLGQKFVGVVSGVTEWGVYVELEDTKIEGMVALRDMRDDYYEFDDKNYRIIGQRRRKIITLGDKVKISVLRADMKRKQLDFELVSLIDFESGRETMLESEPKKSKKIRRKG